MADAIIINLLTNFKEIIDICNVHDLLHEDIEGIWLL